MLYTVVMDYRGGTYISQVSARSVTTTLKVWAAALDPAAIAGLGTQRNSLLRRAGENDRSRDQSAPGGFAGRDRQDSRSHVPAAGSGRYCRRFRPRRRAELTTT